jgi:CheY-like chemotaxis protein
MVRLGNRRMAASKSMSLRDRSDIELVVTDHGMPSMNGAEFARVLRAERPRLPNDLATRCPEPQNGEKADPPERSRRFRP